MANDKYIPDYDYEAGQCDHGVSQGLQCRHCLHDTGEDCGEENCQVCCQHNSSGFDHDTCIDCGYERCPGESIDRAELYYGDDR